MTTTSEEPSASTPKPKTPPSKYSPVFPYDLMIVWWEDAHSSDHWLDAEDLKMEECIAITVGFKFKEDADRLMIVDALIFEEGKIAQVSNTTIIPKGMIRHTKILKKGKG